jgi:hypothetical protein
MWPVPLTLKAAYGMISAGVGLALSVGLLIVIGLKPSTAHMAT